MSAAGFALDHALSAVPSASVEFDRIVAYSQDWMMPFLWVSGSDFDAFDAALAEDATVERAAVTDEFAHTRLYEVTWADAVVEAVDTILDHEGTVLAATGEDAVWELRVRFADRDQLTVFREHFEGSGQFTLERLRGPREPHSEEFGLTGKQRDALLAAYEAGYFERPRAATATDLADGFDLSQQAFSERLRRGVETLVANTLVTGVEPREG